MAPKGKGVGLGFAGTPTAARWLGSAPNSLATPVHSSMPSLSSNCVNWGPAAWPRSCGFVLLSASPPPCLLSRDAARTPGAEIPPAHFCCKASKLPPNLAASSTGRPSSSTVRATHLGGWPGGVLASAGLPREPADTSGHSGGSASQAGLAVGKATRRLGHLPSSLQLASLDVLTRWWCPHKVVSRPSPGVTFSSDKTEPHSTVHLSAVSRRASRVSRIPAF